MNQEQLDTLRPYLVGAGKPNADGELELHCPLHHDVKRSASINLEKGVWHCFAGCGGGDIRELLLRRREWVPPPAAGSRPNAARGNGRPPQALEEGMVKQWATALRRLRMPRSRIKKMRGLNENTLRTYEIGWDAKQKAYSIPVRLVDDTLVNVRFYDPAPPEERRKIWSVPGHGSPQLYPLSQLLDDPREIVVCEGEMDALLTIQHGFHAITRTASAITWHQEWARYFKGRVVYICHDMDKAGHQGNQLVGHALAKVAKEIRIITLPYEKTEKHGKDLTDFWHDHNATTFRRLMEQARPIAVEVAPIGESPMESNILAASNAENVGKPLTFPVTIKGRKDPGYSLPAQVEFSCDVEEAERCANCPLNAGAKDISIPANDPMLLEMIDITKKQMNGVLKEYMGIACKRVAVHVQARQSVEVLYGRPSVDAAPSNDGAGDYKTIKITSSGKHDTMPNTTVQVIGSLYPNPRSQSNEFLAWQVLPVRTSIDAYEPDAATLRALRRFQPRKGERPLHKAGSIAKEMALQVTHIYGRPHMHVLMDLTWHSALAFNVDKEMHVTRGWLDTLLVGDTRTGKSEAAQRLSEHYMCGEIVACEAATYAGIVGGAQQFNQSWTVTWGAVPLNDRRLVVLDEVGGLTREEIAKLSSVRSSGIAEIQMIAQERTRARTRLLWLANPRNGRMSDYTYGVQAIQPLIGNPEDIARFDLAMTAHSSEVGADEINKPHEAPPARYDSEACHALIRWIWSRSPDQIVWTADAANALLKSAVELSQKYIEVPPLVQGANVRYKLARVATALAARTFSCDQTYERLIVTRDHVQDAVTFINYLYEMPTFGYAELSANRIETLAKAEQEVGTVSRYIGSYAGLGPFLSEHNTFARGDLEAFMGLDHSGANGLINTLWNYKMIRMETGGQIQTEPALNNILRSNGDAAGS
jgi:MCM P-loop domain/Toprim-like